MNLKQWLYRGRRPNWIASAVNRCLAAVHALGIAPNYLVTLEVRGRRSGRAFSLPLVMVIVEGERYLVSMLGANAAWVQNAKAAGGNVTLRHGRRENVHLEEVPADRRAPILKAYLERAPGARRGGDEWRGIREPRCAAAPTFSRSLEPILLSVSGATAATGPACSLLRGRSRCSVFSAAIRAGTPAPPPPRLAARLVPLCSSVLGTPAPRHGERPGRWRQRSSSGP